MQNLVTSWVACTVNDLFQIIGGGTPSTKIKEYWNGDIPWITSADIQGLETIISRKNITIDAIQNSAANIVPENSIIVVTRVGLGKIALSKRKISFSQDCQGLVAYHQLVLPKYALYYLSKTVEIFKFENRGTTISGVTKRQLKEVPFLLSPLPEQHCIIEKIEELFSELDNGVESLKKARGQLKVYRQAVLKHAFEGKLTREWREQQIQVGNPPGPVETLLIQIKKERETHYQKQVEAWQKACEQAKKNGSKKPAKPKKPKDLPALTEKELAELPELPKGWIYFYLGYLGELARGKSKHRPRNDQKLFGGNYPFIQTGEVKAAHGIIKTFENTYNETGIAQSKLWPKGTLCITIAANIADTAFLGFDACFPDSIVGFTANKKLIVPKFVDYFIQSNRKKIEAFAPATAQKNINLTTLENLLLPYCELNEQQAIVSEIETRLSVCDQLEQTIEDSLKKAEALRQSILKKAFEGELTKAWREENPELISGENSAKSLLARIRAEKARLAGEEKKRRSGKAEKK